MVQGSQVFLQCRLSQAKRVDRSWRSAMAAMKGRQCGRQLQIESCRRVSPGTNSPSKCPTVDLCKRRLEYRLSLFVFLRPRDIVA